MRKPQQRQQQKTVSEHNDLRQRIEHMTHDLKHGVEKGLLDVLYHNEVNAATIYNYTISRIREVNPSQSHIRGIITELYLLSRFFEHKKMFKEVIEDDLHSYLDTLRKPEEVDPQHKWIGTYNKKLSRYWTFFKWLYSPDIRQELRPIPQLLKNIRWLKRKEISTYKPEDLWTFEEDLIFVKYCPNAMYRCYHMMSRDTGCRPHELLKLRRKDFVIKISPKGIQFAEVTINGKTGARTVPLINSIPYIKDWLNQHREGNNPESMLLCPSYRTSNRKLSTKTLYQFYRYYKATHFTRLLADPKIPAHDKDIIRGLLNKPWNPYIRRHTALTEKSLKIPALMNQFAGWSPGSNMPQKYLHYFAAQSSNALLKEAGVFHKDDEEPNLLEPIQCPNCKAMNKPNAKFCIGCPMVLSYDGYKDAKEADMAVQETTETNQKAVDIMSEMNKRMSVMEETLKSDEWKEFQSWKSSNKK